MSLPSHTIFFAPLTQRRRLKEARFYPAETYHWHPTIVRRALWLEKTIIPFVFRGWRKHAQHAQLAEIVSLGRSRLHQLPVELVYEFIECLDEEDVKRLEQTGVWLR